jgi:hypothetical protein
MILSTLSKSAVDRVAAAKVRAMDACGQQQEARRYIERGLWRWR